MAVITRWSYKWGGRKAGFHCSNNNVVVCNRAGWDKNYTDFKRKGGLQAVYRSRASSRSKPVSLTLILLYRRFNMGANQLPETNRKNTTSHIKQRSDC